MATRKPKHEKTELRPHAPGRTVCRSGRKPQLDSSASQLRPGRAGIFGYSFLYRYLDTFKPAKINRVAPDGGAIADLSCPISRPLCFCAENSHRGVIPNLQEFIEEYMPEGPPAAGGYLGERGLVALPDDERSNLQDAAIPGAMTDAKQLTAFPTNPAPPGPFGAAANGCI